MATFSHDTMQTVNTAGDINTDSSVATSSSNNIMTSSSLVQRGFRFAPPELREMIFAEVFADFVWKWPFYNADTPELLEALQGDSQLLSEAQTVFAKARTFTIPFRGYDWTPPNHLQPLGMIQKLRLLINDESDWDDLDSEKRSIIMGTNAMPSSLVNRLLLKDHLKELHLFFVRKMCRETDRSFFDKASRCFQYLSKLEKVRVGIVELHDDSYDCCLSLPFKESDYSEVESRLIHERYDSQDVGYWPIFEAISDGFGFMGEITELCSETFSWGERGFQFVWEVYHGEVLVWEEPEYVRGWDDVVGCVPFLFEGYPEEFETQIFQ